MLIHKITPSVVQNWKQPIKIQENLISFPLEYVKYTPLIRWLVIAGNDIEKRN